MFGLGDTELLLILLFAFLLFGPDKLPSMGRTIGRGIKQFRQASDSVTKVVKQEVLNPLADAAKTEAGPGKGADDAAMTAAPVKERSQETFAERRARLAKEREEREAAEAAASAASAASPTAEPSEAELEAADNAEAAVLAADDASPAVADAEAGAVPEVPAPRTASVASMWGLEDSVVETGEEDATVPLA